MANSPKNAVPHPADQGLKTTLAGIIINLVLALVKGVAGVLGNSYALIADAIESASDIFASIIVWFGLKVASKAPDHDHPYGHGKAEPLATMVVALFLITAAILIAIQSVHNIVTPHKTPAPFTLLVLVVVIGIKEVMFRYVSKKGAEINSTAVKADAWHHRSDAITSFSAFIGISIGLIGGPGYESADDWAALIAAVIIVYNAYHIFFPAISEVMDAAPPSEIENEIRELAMTVDNVRGLDKCLVRKMGFEYFVDLHVVVDGSLSVRVGHDIAHRVKEVILQAKPQIYDVLVHIEPLEELNGRS